jgi:hypothetical protein
VETGVPREKLLQANAENRLCKPYRHFAISYRDKRKNFVFCHFVSSFADISENFAIVKRKVFHAISQILKPNLTVIDQLNLKEYVET